MPPCGRCGADVRHVYDPDDELMTIDADRVSGGNVSIDGYVSAHRVAPGAGSYRIHDCDRVEQPDQEEAWASS